MRRTARRNWLDFIFTRILACRYSESMAGDLQEMYLARREDKPAAARFWLAGQVILSLGPMLRANLRGLRALYRNYLVLAFRHLRRQKAYTLVNVFGLATGLSAFILIGLYLQFEISYDRFHPNDDRVYRISIRSLKQGQFESESHIFTPPIGENMRREFPEVVDFARMSTLRHSYLRIGDRMHKIEQAQFASPGIFRLFAFPLTAGDPATALEAPFSIVLTESTARRLFGPANPVGETVRIGPEHTYRVTGVAADPPANSTIRFEALLSFATLYSLPGLYLDWNGGNQYITWVQLHPQASPAALEAKFPDFMWRHINADIAAGGWRYEARLQPLPAIHFHHDEGAATALVNVYTFTAVSILILLMACVNFVNLATAMAGRRAREVGLRKVMGAQRRSLIQQFLAEAGLLTIVSFGLGLGLVILLSPIYGHLLDTELHVADLVTPLSVVALTGLMAVVGLAAGLYPAVYLSAYQPVRTLKGAFESGRGRRRFRNALVMVQFTISIMLIVCTFLVRDQLHHLKRVDLGYDKANVVVVPLSDEALQARTAVLRQEIGELPGVDSCSASSDVPFRGFTMNGYRPEGYDHYVMIHALEVDEAFLDTFRIPLVKGRNFSPERATDRQACLINEALARQLGWDEPLGRTIFRDTDRPVIGMVQDFQFATLYDSIGPLLITSTPLYDRYDYLSVRIRGGNVAGTLAAIEAVFHRHSPLFPFEYFFLDEAFDRVYRTEERFERIFLYFSVLAVTIAVLGLFSLSAYVCRQKSREIGIRKVLGASLRDILALFSGEVGLLVLIANGLAAPLAIGVILRWQDNFAYRADIDPWLFAVVLGGSLMTAFATIAYQVLRAARLRPVEELRAE